MKRGIYWWGGEECKTHCDERGKNAFVEGFIAKVRSKSQSESLTKYMLEHKKSSPPYCHSSLKWSGVHIVTHKSLSGKALLLKQHERKKRESEEDESERRSVLCLE